MYRVGRLEQVQPYPQTRPEGESPSPECRTKSRFTEEQILNVLRHVEKGLSRSEACRQFGISEATFYRWKARRASRSHLDLQPRLKSLQEENARLRSIVADLTLNNAVLRDRLEKSKQ
jgi:putative transposase